MLYMLLFISNVCFPSTTQTNHDFYESAINSCLLHSVLQCKGDLHIFFYLFQVKTIFIQRFAYTFVQQNNSK